MSSSSDALRAAFDRVVALTWRGVWLNLGVVALFGAVLIVDVHQRPFEWKVAFFIGLIFALAGFQLWVASGQFARLGSDRPYRWVRPVAVIFFTVGIALIALGAVDGVHHVAAT